MMLRVAARGSRLSVAQTEWAILQLKRADPGCTFEMKRITTRGDTDARPLFAMDRRGVFEKEVNRAVADGRADLAVHSMKDVPADIDPGLVIACVPARGPAEDVLVSRGGLPLESMKKGAVIGTSSLRRAAEIMQSRPDVEVRPVRGNVETRIARVPGEYDAVVLARAGIERLGSDAEYSVLPPSEFVPSPGQGALALVARKGDGPVLTALARIEDAGSRAEADAERALSGRIGSGCRFPVGAHAVCRAGTITLEAAAFSADGSQALRAGASGPQDDPEAVGRSAAEQLLGRGAGDLALNWRERVEEWNRR